MIKLQSLKGYMAKKYFSLQKYSRFKKAIPFVFTFANALFGFLSIIKTIEGNFVFAGLCIMAAALMDAFDGRLARYLGTEGQLGTELDSLCDAISFCLAPAVLMYSWYLHDFGHAGIFVIALVFYVCAGLLRLARFNITAADQSVFFLGLPTSIAAFFIVQIILYQELFIESSLHTLLTEKVLV
ncbi:CDP-diacylglycerol--serine O-phosphatidyltransferase, partial [Candidatus Babeliales bacterium]|nr:CDP-diacylglycerol--serine O-phosphatidyltransferase [Candidatus Babeliales bacterium]